MSITLKSNQFSGKITYSKFSHFSDSGKLVSYHKILGPYMGSALNTNTPNIFKSNKFYRHMALRARKEKQLKSNLKSAKKYAVRHLKETTVFVVC